MIKNILFLGFSSVLLAACASATDGLGGTSQADTVVLDVRCASDADCLNGFECETEVEHGTDASYCVSDDSQGTSTGECPTGYELETEHAETFCKPHGGNGGSGNGGSGNGGSGNGGSGNGGSGNGGNGGNSNGGNGAEGAVCATDADCASGLECEIETERGVVTATCQPHGGKD